MGLPALDNEGYLPEGVHNCTLEEVRARFGSFTTSDYRIMLCDKLLFLIAEAQATGLLKEVIIDGSFVTAKAQPNDVDLILVLTDAPDLGDRWLELRPTHYNALSRRRLAKRYRFDVFVDVQDTKAYQEHLNLFQSCRASARRKGVLRITI